MLSDSGPGLARFSCAGEREFRSLAQGLGTVWKHRDSDGDGVTVIEEKSGASHAGDRGFGAGALQWHTDSSGIAEPPRTILMWCAENDAIGGESMVADASSIDHSVREMCPSLRDPLWSDHAATFYSGAEAYSGPILSTRASRLRIRLRLDELGHLAYPIAVGLTDLIRSIDAVANSFVLRPGMGYALRNDRWLHARLGYQGRRRMLRTFTV
jgi:hypothetical protein